MTESDVVGDERTFLDIARDLSASEPGQVLSALTAAAVRRVRGAEHAGITQRAGVHFRTSAATHEVVSDVDHIQYELRSGPCVDAIEYDTVFASDELATDDRWPVFGPRATATTGIRSMLSFRLFAEADAGSSAALNLYSAQPGAFGQESRRVGHVLATHGALAIAAARATAKVAHLEIALTTNRDIGVAMGILMALHKISRDAAFSLLRTASQDMHRKLAELAVEVIDTGALPAGRAPVIGRGEG